MSPTQGQQMLRFMAKHYGHCYQLGGIYPNCCDCSGWTEYVYARFANVQLPHYTVSQFKLLGGKVGPFPKLGAGKSKIGEIFSDEKDARQGDLVFRSYHGFATAVDNPDHVGIYRSKGVMCDSRSPSEPLADRSIYDGQAGSQTWFGRVYSVNGPVGGVVPVPKALTLLQRYRRLKAQVARQPGRWRLRQRLQLLRRRLKKSSGR